jgi:hypothetical protein
MRTTILVSALAAAAALTTLTSATFAKAPPPASPPPPPVVLPIPQPPSRVTADANGHPLPPAPPTSSASTQIASVPTALPFATVDRNKTGIVTKDQANGDPWLSTNFARCDADHNDEISQGEYEACSTQIK